MSVRRTIGFGFLGIAAVLVLFALFVSVRSQTRLSREWDVAGRPFEVPADSASIERGRHAVHATLACIECHGEDLGGRMFIDAGPMGRVPATNLTSGRGGIGSVYTAADWDRALRHGIGRDGKSLLFMPSEAYAHLSDAELEDVVAYLASLPPIDREHPGRSLGPIARMIIAFGQPIVIAERIDHEMERRTVAPSGADVERGAHLVQISGCVACHGATLAGGKVPGTDPSWPPAGNLTPHPDGLGRYDPASFVQVMTTGAKLDGTQIDPSTMPWPAYARMKGEELTAIWAYLRTVEPRPMP